jgi:hypothetical protein
MKCIGLSLVTNMCITVTDSLVMPNHEEVKEMANKRAATMRSVISPLYRVPSLLLLSGAVTHSPTFCTLLGSLLDTLSKSCR